MNIAWQTRHTTRRALLVGSGIGGILTHVAIASLPAMRGYPLLQLVALFTLAFGLYVLAVVAIGRDASGLRGHLLAIVVVAFAMRAAHWGTRPTLSDDVYRYVWDGHLLAQGVSPYAFRVDSPALDALTIPTRALVNHAWMATPYLPIAQGLFGALALVAPENTLVLQVTMSALDLAAGGLLMLLLKRLGRDPAMALLYLWHPLTVIEAAHSAHVDAWMLCLTVAGLLALLGAREENRAAYWAAPVWLGLASLVKPLPLFLAPVLVWRLGWRRMIVWAGVFVALSAPFVALNGLGIVGPMDGVGLLGATRIYAAQWNFNAGLYHWLEALTTGLRVPWSVPYDVPGATTARVISGVAFLLVLAILSWQARRATTGELLHVCLLAWGGYLLLTTTVHPWYATALVALMPLAVARDERGWWPILPWLWLSYAVVWSYLTYVGEFRELAFVRHLEYLPTIALLAWSLFAGRNGRQRHTQADEAQPVASHSAQKD